jgi:MoaA/NifB/PqqE/SkfB family radical SAM enzyme
VYCIYIRPCTVVNMLKLLRWFVTWKCNYGCEMCLYHSMLQNKEVIPGTEEDIDVERLFKAISLLHPKIMDITGGEPLLRKNVIPLLGRITQETDISVAVTSNISRNLDQFCQLVNPSGICHFTASFHPEFTSERLFLGSLDYLSHRGFFPIVNFVAYPPHLFTIEYYKNFFESHGFTFHVDSYQPYKMPYRYNEEEQKIVEKYLAPERRTDLAEGGENIDVCRCDAGSTIIQVASDLEVYPCMYFHNENKRCMGSLMDRGFSLLTEEIVCRFRKYCGGCDKDHVTIRKIEGRKR